MVIIAVKGQVFSGTSEGRCFVSLSWAMRQFYERLGFAPYPGTLNLRLPAEAKVRKLVNRFQGVKIEPAEGFCSGRCFKALIMGRVNGAVVIPEVPRYPDDVLEVLAPICLREEFNLRDGDEVEVMIWLE